MTSNSKIVIGQHFSNKSSIALKQDKELLILDKFQILRDLQKKMSAQLEHLTKTQGSQLQLKEAYAEF